MPVPVPAKCEREAFFLFSVSKRLFNALLEPLLNFPPPPPPPSKLLLLPPAVALEEDGDGDENVLYEFIHATVDSNHLFVFASAKRSVVCFVA